MKKIIATLGLLLMTALPSFAQTINPNDMSDNCLTKEEWAVSMAAQGLAPVGNIPLSDGSFQYYLIDASKDLYLLFPFDLDGCGVIDMQPITMTGLQLKEAFGIIVS